MGAPKTSPPAFKGSKIEPGRPAGGGKGERWAHFPAGGRRTRRHRSGVTAGITTRECPNWHATTIFVALAHSPAGDSSWGSRIRTGWLRINVLLVSPAEILSSEPTVITTADR